MQGLNRLLLTATLLIASIGIMLIWQPVASAIEYLTNS